MNPLFGIYPSNDDLYFSHHCKPVIRFCPFGLSPGHFSPEHVLYFRSVLIYPAVVPSSLPRHINLPSSPLHDDEAPRMSNPTYLRIQRSTTPSPSNENGCNEPSNSHNPSTIVLYITFDIDPYSSISSTAHVSPFHPIDAFIVQHPPAFFSGRL